MGDKVSGGVIKIKDKDKLIRIFKTISWLDKCRWKNKNNYNFINFSEEDLTNCEKIFTHWICYIMNRQMPFEIIWDKGGYVFSELVREYSRNIRKSPGEIINEYYGEYEENGKKKIGFRSLKNPKYNFSSRYHTTDKEHIFQTLEILDKYKVKINGKEYNRNIVAFILHFVERFKEKEDLLIRVACALHLLTYQLYGNKSNPDRIIEILKNDKKFEEQLKKFKKTSTKGKKRLWCCVRDYKKGLYYEIFIEAIKEVVDDKKYANELIEIWKSLPMDQIELPGDVWNNNPLFKNNLFADVLDLKTIPKTWKMPQIVRDIYNQLKDNEEIEDFYPEQFDITFDFVPRMCSKKLCDVCLFGKNGVDKICIPTKDKYCPVALLSCGYIIECEGENCIIKKGISKGICKGINTKND
jgi:hypothetical protein